MAHKGTWLGLAGWLAVSYAAGLVGSRYLPGPWYRELVKPSWNPPAAVFAPVWTALYALMAIAAWLVWKRAGFAAAALPLALFGAQLVLNAAWTYLFFGLHRPDLAFFEIALLWLLILATTVAFWREQPVAGALLLPYLCWVGFAAALNFRIWRLNV
jgi:benzodiazapine receptor